MVWADGIGFRTPSGPSGTHRLHLRPDPHGPAPSVDSILLEEGGRSNVRGVGCWGRVCHRLRGWQGAERVAKKGDRLTLMISKELGESPKETAIAIAMIVSSGTLAFHRDASWWSTLQEVVPVVPGGIQTRHPAM